MKESESAASVVEVQHQIRNNASQLQDYFNDLYSWEKAISKSDAARKRVAQTKGSAATAPPPPRVRSAPSAAAHSTGANIGGHTKKPDAHTYDKGYKRWEKFDVDAALKEADEEATTPEKERQEPAPPRTAPVARRVVTQRNSASSSGKSREELEREEGNAHYKRGDYVAAIKSYTRCLGHNPQNAVVLSNRAMAYLKNREFSNAEDDCTLALKADPTHVKSFSRRGTARNALGKHRLALLDFHRASVLDPKSRQIQTQLQSTRELMRTAIKRAPKRTNFSIEVVGEPPVKTEQDAPEQDAPEQDDADSENKENTREQGASESLSWTKPTTGGSPLVEVNGVAPASLAPAAKQRREKKKLLLPKLPNKAPATSYEFSRVWKTLALRGDADQRAQLLGLRAKYLRMLAPSALPTVFKTVMESDVLCEVFHVFRHALLPTANDAEVQTDASQDDAMFVLQFASELTKVPRFNMTVMLLSDNEKKDMLWVFDRLQLLLHDDFSSQATELKKLYELR